MSLIILALIILIVVMLLCYAVDQLALAPPFNGLLKLLIILIGVLVIIDRAGIV